MFKFSAILTHDTNAILTVVVFGFFQYQLLDVSVMWTLAMAPWASIVRYQEHDRDARLSQCEAMQEKPWRECGSVYIDGDSETPWLYAVMTVTYIMMNVSAPIVLFTYSAVTKAG